MNTIMGDGMSSRLFLEVRERLGLAYAVDSNVAFMADTGILEAYAALDPAKGETALLAVLGQWARMRDEPVDASELRRAKEYTKGRMLLGLESSMAVAGWWGQQEVVHDESLSADDVIDRVEAVTAEDVQRMAQELLSGKRLRLAMVGPLHDEAPYEAIIDSAQHMLPA
jgi:predicted Zn-dependent peptidase